MPRFSGSYGGRRIVGYKGTIYDLDRERIERGQAPLYSIPEVAKVVEPPDLTLSEKLGLLTLRWKDDLAEKVAREIRDRGARATTEDYAELLKQGYVVPKDGTRYHKLTPRGLDKARRVTRELARAYELHHPIRSDGGDRYSASMSCACGWSTSARRSTTAFGNLNNAYFRHLQSIAPSTDKGAAAEPAPSSITSSEGAGSEAQR